MSCPRPLREALAVFVAYLLFHAAIAPPLRAAQEAAPPTSLTITILEGDNAIVNVRQRVSREAIIQVEDENHKPVGGAILTLSAPRNGASVLFSNDAQSINLTTDAQGKAVVHGMRPNNVAGKVEVRVTAVKEGVRATATFTQTNMIGAAVVAGGLTAKALTILLLAAGAGTGIGLGVAYGTGGGGAKPPGVTTIPPTVITPGSASVGAPK